jgi:uncharacterized protein with PIN domain
MVSKFYKMVVDEDGNIQVPKELHEKYPNFNRFGFCSECQAIFWLDEPGGPFRPILKECPEAKGIMCPTKEFISRENEVR